MGQPVRLPGPRDCRGTLDEATADAAGEVTEAGRDACLVACPPHPQLGGKRSDTRLQAVGETLTERGIDCLRFDYGPWDEGCGERHDVLRALEWARERYGRVGLFGYSFGAGVAAWATADTDRPPAALALLAPPATLEEDLSIAACLDAVAVSLLVIVGERDVTVDSGPVAEAARDRGATVEVFPGDHHFVGQADRIGSTVAGFVAPHLGGDE
jgi:alpha/beta superfamily hydrolase